MTKKEKQERERHFLTLEIGNEQIKQLSKALCRLVEQEVTWEAPGRGAVDGICSAIKKALDSMNKADRHFQD